jgi:N-dimethylarginine dimethylaminohydrolase
MEVRRGEERFVAKKLAELGVPIIKTINGEGIFECACALWVDRRSIVIGTGARANKAAQTRSRRNSGTSAWRTSSSSRSLNGHAHLDGLIELRRQEDRLPLPCRYPYDVARR